MRILDHFHIGIIVAAIVGITAGATIVGTLSAGNATTILSATLGSYFVFLQAMRRTTRRPDEKDPSPPPQPRPPSGSDVIDGDVRADVAGTPARAAECGVMYTATPPQEPSQDASQDTLTVREAAEAIGRSQGLVRKLLREDLVPSIEEETRSGFRYLIDREHLPVLAHVAEQRKSGRGAPSQGTVSPSQVAPTQEAMAVRASTPADDEEKTELRIRVAGLEADNARLEAENTRAWAQIEKLTDTVTQLALPPAREETPEPEKPKRSTWDWFLGRG